MGFPIVTGGKSSSSTLLEQPSPIEEYSATDCNDTLRPVVLDAYNATVAVDNRHGLTATISTSYYDMIRLNGSRESTVIEFRIQITPLTSINSSSTTYRNMLHRINLPDSMSSNSPDTYCNDKSDNDESYYSNSHFNPIAVFSADGRNLACLVSYPREQRAAVIIFQLRKPRATSTKTLVTSPPIPSYVSHTLSPPKPSTMIVPVATNPEIVVASELSSCATYKITSICDASTLPDRRTGPSVLLAGCSDGCIVAISYRLAQVCGILMPPLFSDDTIVSMAHTTAEEQNVGEERIPFSSRGKLVTIRQNGKAVIYSSHLVPMSDFREADEVLFAQNHLDETKKEGAPVSPPATEKTSNVQVIKENGNVNGYHKQTQHAHNHDTVFIPSTTGLSRYSSSSAGSDKKVTMIKIHPLTTLKSPYSFACGKWISSSLLALVVIPHKHHHSSAQVWSIRSNGTAQTLSTLTMTADRLDEYAHGSFVLEDNEYVGVDQYGEKGIDDCSENDNLECVDNRYHSNKYGPTMGLQYDRSTGCVAVSSVVVSCGTIQPYVCTWHWLTNAVGLMLSSRTKYRLGSLPSETLLSCLYFAHDKRKGQNLIHATARLTRTWQSHSRIRKAMFETGIVSPPESVYQNGFTIRPTNSLLLSPTTITFPSLSSPLNCNDFEVEWMESIIPLTYTEASGTVHLATIGQRRGRSIAVAASHGFCVLRINIEADKEIGGQHNIPSLLPIKSGRMTIPRWRLFGSEADEKRFRVIDMVWWELDDAANFNCGRKADDILVTIIGLESGEKYLACWSRRRLDFAGQLLEEVGKDKIASAGYGIRLPKDFTPSSLSILVQPSSDQSQQKLPHNNTVGRASILLSSSSRTNLNDQFNRNCGIKYMSFQCQLVSTEQDSGTKLDNKQHWRILAENSSSGSINLEHWSDEDEAHSSVFLAGTSFQFDLLKGSDEAQDDSDFIATLGIVRTPGLGLDSVSITRGGSVVAARIIGDSGKHKTQVSRFWLTDIIHNSSVLETAKSLPYRSSCSNFFVWAFETNGGILITWSVPFFEKGPKRQVLKNNSGAIRSSSLYKSPAISVDECQQIFPPIDACESRDFFGIVCSIGDSSAWISDSLAANRTEFSLGQVPNSSFGCILSAGQRARKLHRDFPAGFDSTAFATNFLDHEVFGIGECSLTPPACVTSIYSCLLSAAANEDYAENQKIVDTNLLRKHACVRLSSDYSRDATLMMLRLLTLRTVETLANETKRVKRMHGHRATNRDRTLDLARSIFREVVDAARITLSPLEFASLFLGVGRQIEPSCLPHLFPLPLSNQLSEVKSRKPHYAWRTAGDLYAGCFGIGSLSIASSALPLCASRLLSKAKCAELLQHCLLCLQRNTFSYAAISFDVSMEERQFIYDLFRFGIKLEDAELLEEDESSTEFTPDSEDESTESSSSGDNDDDEDYVQVVSHQNNPPAASLSSSYRAFEESSSLLSFLWGGGSNRKKKQKKLSAEEQAISEAASTFIASGFEEHEFESSSLMTNSNSFEAASLSSSNENEQEIDSKSIDCVAETIGRFLVSITFLKNNKTNNKVDDSCHNWARACALASLLIVSNNNDNNNNVTELDMFHQILDDLSLDDIVGAIRCNTSHPFHDDEIININHDDENDDNTSSSTSPKSQDNGEKERSVVEAFMAYQIFECEKAINNNRQESDMIFRLVLLLISRSSEEYNCTDDYLEDICPMLIILGIVACHHAGRIHELFFTNDDGDDDNNNDNKQVSILKECYMNLPL